MAVPAASITTPPRASAQPAHEAADAATVAKTEAVAGQTPPPHRRKRTLSKNTISIISKTLDLPLKQNRVLKRALNTLRNNYPGMKITKELGSGACGKVFLCEHEKPDGTIGRIVLKLSTWDTVRRSPEAYGLDRKRAGGKFLTLLDFNNENVANALAALVYEPTEGSLIAMQPKDFQNVYKYPFLLKEGQQSYLVGSISQYMEGAKDLFEYAKERGSFTEQEVRSILRQVLSGLAAMHKKGLIHRDLKMENTLIDSNGLVQICDFGFARKLPEEEEPLSPKGTLPYMSSARMEKHIMSQNSDQGGYAVYGQEEDIYAVGALAYMLTTLEEIGKETNQENMHHHIQNAIHQRGLEALPRMEKLAADNPQLADLICKTGAFLPEDRPSIEEILQHPYFQDSVGSP